MSSFNLTHDGLTIKVERVTLDPNDIRIMTPNRLRRMGAIGAAELARREAVQDRALATMRRA